MVETFLDLLQLRLEFLVLNGQAAVSVLEQRLQILNTLIPSKKLALCDTCLLLEGRVLVDKLVCRNG